jgi:hypothetical protein
MAFFPFSSGPKRSWQVTVDPANIAANTLATTDVTLPGLKKDHIVLASMPNLEAGLVLTWRVKAANTLELRIFNATAAAINPAAQTLNVIAL